MFQKIILALALLVMAQSSAASAIAAETTLLFAPRTVVLTGKIEIDRYLVPPTYFENPNSEVIAPILVLQKPISVKNVGDPEAKPGSWRFGITRLQIIPPPANYEALCGSLVQVKGSLAESSGDKETRVALNIDQILSRRAAGTCVTNDHTVISHRKPSASHG
jgi:hypothetical protein